MGKILYHVGCILVNDKTELKVFMVRDKNKLPLSFKDSKINSLKFTNDSIKEYMGTVMTTKKQWDKNKWVILANLKKYYPGLKKVKNIIIC